MELKFGKKIINKNSKFIIAEIGNNHNGSYQNALKMIDRAVEIGVDCVKFQMRHLDEVYRDRTLKGNGDDLGTEYVVDLLKRFELSLDDHKRLFNYCTSKDIMYLCTPWDISSIKILESYGVLGYKVASADLTNIPLIKALIKTKKPLILSTGMATKAEIKKTVGLLNESKARFALLHCNSTYPAPYHDINLRWMQNMKRIHSLVGYSGHERGVSISFAAAALGACIIERHFTLDRNMEGPDHAASLEYNEFKSLVDGIKNISEALGSGEKTLSQGEMINRENLGKSLVSSRKIKKGEIIQQKDVKVCSPGQGLNPQKFNLLVGKKINRNMELEDFFYDSDIIDDLINPRVYNFSRPWGIPVRYHDFNEFNDLIKPNLFEFHLSYKDLEINFNKYLKSENDCDYVVHAPELFNNSHLLDLASPDENYRSISKIEMQKVIDITVKLNNLFPKTIKPLIVTNIGGFSMDSEIKETLKDEYYSRFYLSLSELNCSGVEIIPQTMAPFPWHFGGQRYQNLFVKIDEIEKWCNKFDTKMCFDVSHSFLACNYMSKDFYDFAERIAPFTAHIHFGDAKGLNGEGLQIGRGDINFKKLGRILKRFCPSASFIPEIWQGHKNRGQDFWRALELLEGKV